MPLLLSGEIFLDYTSAYRFLDMFNISKYFHSERYLGRARAFRFFKYLGPGLLVTVGFIDPGNWASNIAAGAGYGYTLLWMVTLSTLMLILLQHNVARLGIVTGDCLAEAATKHLPWAASKAVLLTAVAASVSTALAELLGGAIALNMLFGVPISLGTFVMLLAVLLMLFTNSYKRMERMIIGFVSIIGFSFVFELSLVDIDWPAASVGWVWPSLTVAAMPVVMSVLGAVVMPHNLFLHSEIIQSRQWNLQDEQVMNRQLKYEFMDTLFSMLVGWAINSAMILLAAATFFSKGIQVAEIQQAQQLLEPFLGAKAALVFALALLFAGFSSSITAGMAGGSIYAGIFGEPYDIKDRHTRFGVVFTLGMAALLILFVRNPFDALVYSQVALSIQLPITIFLQVYLTSSEKVMGLHRNGRVANVFLWITGLIVSGLNVMLLLDFFLQG